MSPQQFQRHILTWYRHHGRHTLPWRQTANSYAIAVSEIMLQQTQVDRVIDKYRQWLKRFPSVATLARARRASVLRAWQGLGYNRRALFLHQAAGIVHRQYGDDWPTDVPTLETLPGFGPYTAKAVAVFAGNYPAVLIETNIRRVYLHFFFPRRHQVADKQLVPIITQTLDRRNPRRWYSALMDYGAVALAAVPNPNRRSRHYVRQSPFAGSARQLRGQIIRALTSRPHSRTALVRQCRPASPAQLGHQLEQLEREQLIHRHGQVYRLG